MGIEVQNPLALGGILVLIVMSIGALLAMQAAPAAPSTTDLETPLLSSPLSKPGFSLAPDFVGIAGSINTEADLSLLDVRGKVVLVDFWTYSCINCIRTQPYLNAWYEKYADQGLVIVGVHTPEFDFEKKIENVQAAVDEEQIQYPILLDNDYRTWRAYQNRYWPRKYLIDADGFIRYDHIGEGAYEETEAKIQELLRERDASLAAQELVSDSIAAQQDSPDFSQPRTPELYLGYAFARVPLGNEPGLVPEETISYTLPPETVPDRVYLEGTWKSHTDHLELVSETGKIVLTFSAMSANIVAGANAPNVTLESEVEGQEPQSFSIADEKLYNSVAASPTYGTRTLTLTVSGAGFMLYTFTFG